MIKLKELRKAAGLTQKQLADASGVHISIIGRIERGERDAGNLSLKTAADIAKKLGCHAEELLCD